MTVLSESIVDKNFFDTIFAAVVARLGQPSALAVGVEEVDKETIHTVNFEQRQVDRATDVLSFPTQNLKAGEVLKLSEHPEDVDPELNELYLGDIMICQEVACEQAEEYGHSIQRETGYLFCHALLHLFGYDHINESDKAQMRGLEEAVMTECRLIRKEV